MLDHLNRIKSSNSRNGPITPSREDGGIWSTALRKITGKAVPRFIRGLVVAAVQPEGVEILFVDVGEERYRHPVATSIKACTKSWLLLLWPADGILLSRSRWYRPSWWHGGKDHFSDAAAGGCEDAVRFAACCNWVHLPVLRCTSEVAIGRDKVDVLHYDVNDNSMRAIRPENVHWPATVRMRRLNENSRSTWGKCSLGARHGLINQYWYSFGFAREVIVPWYVCRCAAHFSQILFFHSK